VDFFVYLITLLLLVFLLCFKNNTFFRLLHISPGKERVGLQELFLGILVYFQSLLVENEVYS